MERMLQNTIKLCHKLLSKIFLVLFNSKSVFLWNGIHIEELEKVCGCRFSPIGVENLRVFQTTILLTLNNTFEKALYIRYTLISLVPVTFIFRVSLRA